jgi:hypothetical protein
MSDHSSTWRTWRTRLASLVAALGASVALTTGSSASIEATTPPLTAPGVEMQSSSRLAKLIFRRSAQGTLRVADHSSHSSHVSHHSHYSSHMR